MPWYELDTNADAVLDAIFGSTTLGPATFSLRLWDEDPLNGGTEVTNTANLSRLAITNNATNFPAASGGVKTSIPFVLTATGVTNPATWWSLHDSATGYGWARGRMSDAWEAAGNGDSVSVECQMTTPNDVV